jgi:hypothetical protein
MRVACQLPDRVPARKASSRQRETIVAHRFDFARPGGSDGGGASRIVGGISLAYVVVLALLVAGGVLLRLHIDGATSAPVAPIGYRGGWSGFSA